MQPEKGTDQANRFSLSTPPNPPLPPKKCLTDVIIPGSACGRHGKYTLYTSAFSNLRSEPPLQTASV
ncbi:hypothetical protein C0Q70_02667 [Pomacea canaliculata]|uniref:Uncharacterized protein n=1 Tax=Pomacea canaliculata TaxID=400727 RepID=A0A2T7PQK4_POMCA|nr:hypothetical protein C0Q70_02667 [Pomacea canaliculata]